MSKYCLRRFLHIVIAVNPCHAKVFFNYPLEVVSRYRDPQLQVAKNYSYLLNVITIICKSCCLDTHFAPDISDLIDYQAELKTTIIVISEMTVDRFYIM